jgi:hypothetical protein
MAHPLQPVYDFIMRRKIAKLRKTDPDLAATFDPVSVKAETDETGLAEIEMVFKGSALSILADEAAKMMQASGAKNFLEVSAFSVHADQPVLITMQWAYANTPAKECDRLRKQVAELEAKVAEADRAWTEVFKLREQIEAGQLKPWER